MSEEKKKNKVRLSKRYSQRNNHIEYIDPKKMRVEGLVNCGKFLSQLRKKTLFMLKIQRKTHKSINMETNIKTTKFHPVTLKESLERAINQAK